MINYTNPNGLQQNPNFMGQQQSMPQFPYGSNNMLLNNSLYENYLSRMNNSQNISSNQFLKCQPVSSKEEARAHQIDLDGSLWVFTDVGNGKIYTKQVNNDGTAAFKTYVFTEDENPYSSTEYVTKAEFDKVIQTLMAAIPSNASAGSGRTQTNQGESKTLMNF